MMFQALKNRYFFTGSVVVDTGLHVGSGRGDPRTDAPVIRDFKDQPFIPGSSLRGALRSAIERIAESLGLNPCLLIEERKCVTTSPDVRKKLKQLKEQVAGGHCTGDKISEFLLKDENVCPICRLFGSPSVASKIRVSDLQMSKSGGKSGIRDGVAIDRDTEAARDKAKFDFEVVARTSKFSLEIIGENLEERDLQLLAIGFREMISGNFWLGGNSARGLGKCHLENLTIRYFDGIEGLKKYLKAGQETGLTTMDSKTFLDMASSIKVPEGAKNAEINS